MSQWMRQTPKLLQNLIFTPSLFSMLRNNTLNPHWILFLFILPGKSKAGVKYTGTIEVPNLSDENDMEDLDVSFSIYKSLIGFDWLNVCETVLWHLCCHVCPDFYIAEQRWAWNATDRSDEDKGSWPSAWSSGKLCWFLKNRWVALDSCVGIAIAEAYTAYLHSKDGLKLRVGPPTETRSQCR